MLIYLALAGAAMVLFWVDDADERERLRAYAVALGGGTALAFLVFASNDNRHAVCDALSPVWLSDALLGGALLFGLAWLSPARLEAAAGAGRRSRASIVAAFHALTWPHCLQRLEGVSPEVERLWLSHVKEARPIYRHGWRIATLIVALPITGAIGWALLDLAAARATASCCGGSLGAAAARPRRDLLLLWQTRTGPAAQMMAVVGARGARLVPGAAGRGTRKFASCGCSARRWSSLIGAGAAVPLVARLHSRGQADAARAGDRQGQPAVRIAVGHAGRSRCSPRAWCSPSSTSGRG